MLVMETGRHVWEGKHERFLDWRAVLAIHWRRACLFDKRGDETAVPLIFALCVVVAAIGLLLQWGGKCISVDHAFSPRPSIGGGMVKHEKAMTSVCRSHRFHCFPACKEHLFQRKTRPIDPFDFVIALQNANELKECFIFLPGLDHAVELLDGAFDFMQKANKG